MALKEISSEIAIKIIDSPVWSLPANLKFNILFRFLQGAINQLVGNDQAWRTQSRALKKDGAGILVKRIEIGYD